MKFNFIEDTERVLELLLPYKCELTCKDEQYDRLPDSAWEVASFEDEVDHSPGVTWKIDITLFVLPLKGKLSGMALLELGWDDNWGRWEWRCPAAVSGSVTSELAEATLLAAYRDECLPNSEGSYRNFLLDLA